MLKDALQPVNALKHFLSNKPSHIKPWVCKVSIFGATNIILSDFIMKNIVSHNTFLTRCRLQYPPSLLPFEFLSWLVIPLY